MTQLENVALTTVAPGAAVPVPATTPKKAATRKAPARAKGKGDTLDAGAGMAAAALPDVPKVVSTTTAETKAEMVLKRLRSTKGTTIAALSEATGWQAHSVRGFLSGTVRKKLGLNLVGEIGKDGVRRYRIAAASSTDA